MNRGQAIFALAQLGYIHREVDAEDPSANEIVVIDDFSGNPEVVIVVEEIGGDRIFAPIWIPVSYHWTPEGAVKNMTSERRIHIIVPD